MMTCIVNKKPNHQHTQHIATGTTKENCISHCLLTSHTTPPRMIHRLHLHLNFFVLLTHAPHTELPTLQMSFIALQFGINHQKIHNECLSVPILATNPNHLTVLQYSMLWLECTNNYSSTHLSYLKQRRYIIVLLFVQYCIILFYLLILPPWSKLMIDTLTNGINNMHCVV